MTRKHMLACAAVLLLAPSVTQAKEDKPGLQIKLREVERVLTLAPGERGDVPSACLPGEAVVGGSPTGIPASVVPVLSNLFFDGVGSGWNVTWENQGAETVSVVPTTGALCVKGTITNG